MNKLTILALSILTSLQIEATVISTEHIYFPTALFHCITETDFGSASRPVDSYAAFTAKSLAKNMNSIKELARLDLFQSEKMSCTKVQQIKIDSKSHFTYLPAELTIKLGPIKRSAHESCSQLIEGKIVIHQSRASDIIQLPQIQLLAQEIEYFNCKHTTKENL